MDKLVVLAIPHELISAAQGRAITLATLDGTQVVLRLPTVEEAIQLNLNARESCVAQGIPLEILPPPLDRDLAEQLVRPLPGG